LKKLVVTRNIPINPHGIIKRRMTNRRTEETVGGQYTDIVDFQRQFGGLGLTVSKNVQGVGSVLAEREEARGRKRNGGIAVPAWGGRNSQFSRQWVMRPTLEDWGKIEERRGKRSLWGGERAEGVSDLQFKDN